VNEAKQLYMEAWLFSAAINARLRAPELTREVEFIPLGYLHYVKLLTIS
jgi:hypothetical protein